MNITETALRNQLMGLEWRIVANADRGRAVGPLWQAVMAATGYGSTRARAMCARAGFDPDQLVGETGLSIEVDADGTMRRPE